MTVLPRVHTLVWTMQLTGGGYTCWELIDSSGRRWGWVINAAAIGWTSHVGDWGQAGTLGLPKVPVDENLNVWDTAADGRAWVEEDLARQWKSKRTHDDGPQL